jgi:hypothetical protein
MARADILVINPNSNPAVTAGLDAALGPLRLSDGPSIRCMTLCEGPFGIESQQDVERVALPLRRLKSIPTPAATPTHVVHGTAGPPSTRKHRRKKVMVTKRKPKSFGPNLDFSNISVHRGRESEKAVVLQQFLSGSGTPRCRQSVRWSGLNLKPLRAARWLPALMAATSPRMRGRCYWGKSIAASA